MILRRRGLLQIDQRRQLALPALLALEPVGQVDEAVPFAQLLCRLRLFGIAQMAQQAGRLRLDKIKTGLLGALHQFQQLRAVLFQLRQRQPVIQQGLE